MAYPDSSYTALEGYLGVSLGISEYAAIRFQDIYGNGVDWGTVDIYDDTQTVIVEDLDFYTDPATGLRWIVFPKSLADNNTSLYIQFKDLQSGINGASRQTATFTLALSDTNFDVYRDIDGIGQVAVYSLNSADEEVFTIELFPFKVVLPELCNPVTADYPGVTGLIEDSTTHDLYFQVGFNSPIDLQVREEDPATGEFWPLYNGTGGYANFQNCAVMLNDAFYPDPFTTDVGGFISLRILYGSSKFNLSELLAFDGYSRRAAGGSIETDNFTSSASGEYADYLVAFSPNVLPDGFESVPCPYTYKGGLVQQESEPYRTPEDVADNGYGIYIAQVLYKDAIVFTTGNGNISYVPGGVEYEIGPETPVPSLEETSKDVVYYSDLTLANTQSTSGVPAAELVDAPDWIHYRVAGEQETISVNWSDPQKSPYPGPGPTFRNFLRLSVPIPACAQDADYRLLWNALDGLRSNKLYDIWKDIFRNKPQFDWTKVRKEDELGKAKAMKEMLREQQYVFFEEVVYRHIVSDIETGNTAWSYLNEKYKIDCSDRAGWCKGFNVRDRLVKEYKDQIEWGK